MSETQRLLTQVLVCVNHVVARSVRRHRDLDRGLLLHDRPGQSTTPDENMCVPPPKGSGQSCS